MVPAALLALAIATPVAGTKPPERPPAFRGPEAIASPLDMRLLGGGARKVLERGPEEWCPAGEDFLRWLRSQEARSSRPQGPLKRHGGGPAITLQDGVIVMEDDGTLLANDRRVDLGGMMLQFTPQGSDFSVESLPADWDPDPGTLLWAGVGGNYVEVPVDLTLFAFPFAGASQSRVWATSGMTLAFADPTPPGAAQLYLTDDVFDRTPRVAPLASGTSQYGWDAYFREQPDRAVFTWIASDGGGIDVAVQATLHADGRIWFSYASTQGVLHGSPLVVDGDPEWWADVAWSDSASDPLGDVPIAPPDGPAIDVLAVRGYQVGASELMELEVLLAAPLPQATNGTLQFAIELRDEPGGPVFNTLWAEWQNGRFNWTNTRFDVLGSVLRCHLLKSAMPLLDDDVDVLVWTAQDWNWQEAVGVTLAYPAPPSPLMRDFSAAPLPAIRGPVVEAFTLPTLLPGAVYDAFREHFDDPFVDGLAIYQNFYTEIIFWAGAYSTVGNAGADGVGAGNTTDPPSPALLHMNALRYGWNSWNEGKVMVLNHEFGHHWLYFFSIMENGSPTRVLGEGHPAGWTHTPAAAQVYTPRDASCMGGSSWVDNLDGTFTSSPTFASYGYSWHELYLMGLADPGEQVDWFYLRDSNPPLPGAYWPGDNTTCTATRVDVTFDQLVQAMQPRNPDRAGSRHDFVVPMVLVVRPGELTQADVDEVEYTCDLWAPQFNVATVGRGTVTCDRVGWRPPDVLITDPPADLSVTPGTVLSFTGLGDDPDGDAVDLAWDFGGLAAPQTGPGPHPVAFPNPGLFAITLTGTDATGMPATADDVRWITVACSDPEEVQGLRVAKGVAGLTFTWTDLAPLPDQYVLLSADVPVDGFTELATGPTGLTVALPPGPLVFFKVAGRNLPDCLGPY